MRKYRVHVGGKRYRYFPSIEAAQPFLQAEFARRGVILSIVETPKRAARLASK